MLKIDELKELVKRTRFELKDEKSQDEPRIQLRGKGVDLRKASLYLSGRIYGGWTFRMVVTKMWNGRR